MKVVEHLQNPKNPLISYEIVPPPRGHSLQDILNVVERLAPFRPPFIDVTSHAASAYYKQTSDGTITRKIHRKRPGTLGICGIIQNRYQIDTVAHVLCHGFTKEETEDALIELSFMGIENVLALRGDESNYKKTIRPDRTVNDFALNLVEQITNLNQGIYLDPDLENTRPMNFGIGVAGYPEKHFESPNLKADLSYLKNKIDAGAEYIVTQMFFDNQAYFDYVRQCRDININVPIIPGLKVINKVRQIQALPKHFHIDLPPALVDEIQHHPQHVVEIGIRWAQKQALGLLEKGAPCLHFYVLDDASSVVDIVKNLL